MQLIEKPEDFYRRVQRYSTGVILSIIFGRRGPTFEGAVQDIYDVMEPWSESRLQTRQVNTMNVYADWNPFL